MAIFNSYVKLPEGNPMDAPLFDPMNPNDYVILHVQGYQACTWTGQYH